MTLRKAADALAQINDAALRAAAHNLAVDRGMARTEAMRSGPGTAPPAPKPPAPAYAPPPAPAAPAAPPAPPVGWGGTRSDGWDARRSSSMSALDAARREREAKGRKP
jgi:hypothetical protein